MAPRNIQRTPVRELISPGAVLMDAGCGRTAPVLRLFRGQAGRLIGVDVVEPADSLEGVDYIKADVTATGLSDQSVDIIMARSVMEHVDDPAAVYAEFARVLKPGGHVVFLTANLWDYVSLIAKVVPNRWHPWIVAQTEGRAMHDTFPTRFRSNTRRSIQRAAAHAGLHIDQFEYLGQHPSYLQFSGPLYWIGSCYERFLASVSSLHWLRGWILCTLRKPGAS